MRTVGECFEPYPTTPARPQPERCWLVVRDGLAFGTYPTWEEAYADYRRQAPGAVLVEVPRPA